MKEIVKNTGRVVIDNTLGRIHTGMKVSTDSCAKITGSAHYLFDKSKSVQEHTKRVELISELRIEIKNSYSRIFNAHLDYVKAKKAGIKAIFSEKNIPLAERSIQKHNLVVQLQTERERKIKEEKLNIKKLNSEIHSLLYPSVPDSDESDSDSDESESASSNEAISDTQSSADVERVDKIVSIEQARPVSLSEVKKVFDTIKEEDCDLMIVIKEEEKQEEKEEKQEKEEKEEIENEPNSVSEPSPCLGGFKNPPVVSLTDSEKEAICDRQIAEAIQQKELKKNSAFHGRKQGKSKRTRIKKTVRKSS